MIAVATDPASDILFHPVIKKTGIIVTGFRTFPHIESLIDDEKTHLIGELHKFFRRHIVGGPDRVDPHIF